MNPILCHPDKKRGGRGLCKTCYLRVWRTENPDKDKAARDRYYEKHRDRLVDKARSFRLTNPEEYKERNRQNYHRFKERRLRYLDRWKKRNAVKIISHRYGAPESEVLRILAISECEVCGSTKDLHVDHDHLSGVLRGRLCKTCNMAIGLLKDSSDIAFNVGRYLLKHNNNSVQPYPERLDLRTAVARRKR